MRAELRLVTPDLAAKYLSRNGLNRPLTAPTVDFYADQMKKNLWRATGQGISIDVNNNLLDGQHRLAAIVKSRVAVLMLIIYEVDPETFDVYDSGKTRTKTDVFFIKGIPEARNVSSIINHYYLLNAGQNVTNAGLSKEKIKRSTHEILQKYYADELFWADLTKRVGRAYSKIRIYETSKIGGFAAHLILDKKREPELVYSFIEQLFSLTPDEYTCTKVLREYMIKEAFSIKKTPASTRFALLIKTWNYYEAKRNTVQLSYKSTDVYPVIS